MPRFLDNPEWYDSSGNLVTMPLSETSTTSSLTRVVTYNESTHKLETMLLSIVRDNVYVHSVELIPEGAGSSGHFFITIVTNRANLINTLEMLWRAVEETVCYLPCSGVYIESGTSSYVVGDLPRFAFIGSATNIFVQTLSGTNRIIESVNDFGYYQVAG